MTDGTDQHLGPIAMILAAAFVELNVEPEARMTVLAKLVGLAIGEILPPARHAAQVDVLADIMKVHAGLAERTAPWCGTTH